MIEFDEDKQNKKLGELRKKEEEDLARYLAEKYQIEYADLSGVLINNDALRVVSEDEARTAKLAVYNIAGKNIKVGVQSPVNPNTEALVNSLREHGYVPTLYMISPESLEKVWNRYKDLAFSFETKAGSLDIANDEIVQFLNSVKSLEDVKKLIAEVLALKKSYRVSKILEMILAGALSTKASDIHLEPEEGYVRLRYRLDGVLVDILHFDRETYNLLLSRLKLLSGLKLNLTGAQDGRFSVKLNDSDIEIRTSVLPSAYKESVVMRVLNPNAISVPLEELGIEPHLYELIQKEIANPNGMILTTGPTGSGKTTTLYAFLKKIHVPGIKIITIENPIEYHLPGVVQTQTDEDKGYTFLEGLRSALRQDPDVIMVGEIRDEETAEIAVNAALTGHLVFSTLHTNNAAGAFPRLIDLGVNPKVITSAISISIAQRLVRKLCPLCKKEVALKADEKATIERILKTLPKNTPMPKKLTSWTAVGCATCNSTGYKGRVGVYEAILTDEKIEKIVKENPSEREIRNAAKGQGILNLPQDAIMKMLTGVTSLDEINRVIDLTEEL